ncbi:MAG TPA: hypothetical protein VGM03_14500 [Phycisphaerae bacterium]|jgi:hypothetical protein
MTALSKPDWYTKAVLTVIALCLVWICVKDVSLVAPAQAQITGGQGQVTIVGVSKEVVLPVSIVAKPNAPAVPVKFEGTVPVPVKIAAVKKDPKDWDALKIDQGAAKP